MIKREPPMEVNTINGTIQRARACGYPITNYTLKRAIKTGALPCRILGRKYLIAWDNFEKWLLCADGQDNIPPEVCDYQTSIRRIEV